MPRLIRLLIGSTLSVVALSTLTVAYAATTSIIATSGPVARIVGLDTASSNRLISYAVVDPTNDFGRVYRTTDGGITWDLLSNSPTGRWEAVTTSGNGATVVIVGSQSNTAKAYRSTDSGETWTSVGPATAASFTDVEISANGTRAAIASSVGLYRSTNFLEATPTYAIPVAPVFTGPEYPEKIAMSDSGLVIWSVSFGGRPWRSLDGGDTWMNPGPGDGEFQGVATSADGQQVFVVERNQDGQFSTDGGMSWMMSPSLGFAADQLVQVAMSPDGLNVLAASYGSKVMISRNSGESFAELAPNGPWHALTVSNSVNGVVPYSLATENDQIRSQVTTPAPRIDSVSVSTGPSAGGTVVELTGSYFYDVQGITFGGVAGTNVTLTDETLLSVTTPPGTSGSADIVITTDHGSFTASTRFVYVSPAPPATISTTQPPARFNNPLSVLLNDGLYGPSNVLFSLPPAPWLNSDNSMFDPRAGLLRFDFSTQTNFVNYQPISNELLQLWLDRLYRFQFSGFLPGEEIFFAQYSEPTVLARIYADANGRVDANLRLAENLTGTHTLVVYGIESGKGFALPIEINAAELPNTGASDHMALAAWVLIVSGLSLIAFTRPRRRSVG